MAFNPSPIHEEADLLTYGPQYGYMSLQCLNIPLFVSLAYSCFFSFTPTMHLPFHSFPLLMSPPPLLCSALCIFMQPYLRQDFLILPPGAAPSAGRNSFYTVRVHGCLSRETCSFFHHVLLRMYDGARRGIRNMDPERSSYCERLGKILRRTTATHQSIGPAVHTCGDCGG